MDSSALAGAGAVFLSGIYLFAAFSKMREWIRGGHVLPDNIERSIDRGAGRLASRYLAPIILVVVEVLIAIGLIVVPSASLPITVAISVVTLTVAFYLPDGEPCRCFGSALEFGRLRSGRILRNTLLTTIAAAATYSHFLITPISLSPSSVILAFCPLVVLASLDQLVAASGRTSRQSVLR